MAIKLTKDNLAKQLGISRPTLDKYLDNGFPTSITERLQKNGEQDKNLEKILLENEIRVYEYKLSTLKNKLKELESEDSE